MAVAHKVQLLQGVASRRINFHEDDVRTECRNFFQQVDRFVEQMDTRKSSSLQCAMQEIQTLFRFIDGED